jgi:hypothetical protein
VGKGFIAMICRHPVPSPKSGRNESWPKLQTGKTIPLPLSMGRNPLEQLSAQLFCGHATIAARAANRDKAIPGQLLSVYAIRLGQKSVRQQISNVTLLRPNHP